MKFLGLAAGVLALGFVSAQALADGYPAVPLFSGSKTVMDEDIAYPATGQAQVNAMIVTIAPGAKTELHQHGVPVFIHVLEGEVTVDYGDRGTKVFKQGESFLEAMKVTHAGMNLGSVPVRILAVYMGAAGAQDVISMK